MRKITLIIIFIISLIGCASGQTESTIAPLPTTQVQATSTPFIQREISVWALYPEQITLRQQAGVITEVNYVWYRLTGNGKITGSNPSPGFVKELQAMRVRVMPAIQNSGFNPDYVSFVINDQAARSQHVQDITSIVVSENYDGIDIDYESLHPVDKDNFSLFIEELADSLHKQGKLLSVTVHAKTSDNASWDGPNAQDWKRLGGAADMFKIMTYDFTSGTGNFGPIAPISWTNEVLTYAELKVQPSKIYVGIPFYGYDYGVSKKKDVSWTSAQALIVQYDAKIQRDENTEAFFTYELGGQHNVYFNDAAATEAKIKSIFGEHPDLKGVAIWVLGGEDPNNWNILRQYLRQVTP